MKRDLPLASPALPRVVLDGAWRNALPPLAVALVAIVAAYFGTASEIVGTWMRSQTYAHGFVVVPIALWLVYRMRERLARCPLQPSWVPLPALAFAGFAWLLGQYGAVNALSQFSFVAMLVLAVPAIVGIPAARTLMFPLGFLFFAVPIGDFLLPLLMDRTADFTITALRATNVPVYREGLQFVIPSGRWSVIEACGGVRYLIASVMTGTLFAYLTYRSNVRRAVFVGVAIVVPIVANWIRAYMIVMLAHLTNNAIAASADHVVYGWIFFGLVMLAMFWIGARWQQAPQAAAPPGAWPPSAAAPSRHWLLAVLVIVVTAAWPLRFATSAAPADGPVALAAPGVAGWTERRTPPPPFVPQFQMPSAMLSKSFVSEGDAVDLYVAYYRSQTHNRKLASSENVLVRSMESPWVPVASRVRAVGFGSSRHDVVATVLRGPHGERVDAWKWYWIDGGITSSDAVAKARIALERLRGHGDDGAAVVVYAMSEDGADSTPLLDRFVREAWPGIEASLRKAGGTP